jgi:cation diffusion facilitator family transporter
MSGTHVHHSHKTGIRGLIASVFRPHSHDAGDSIDSALTTSKEGVRALKISLAGLTFTAGLQLVVVLFSHSVGLFADMVHNFADALTAVPLGIAFMVGRRLPNRRYTYGYGRGEDLAGLVILVVIAFSSALAAWSAVDRLIHPHTVQNIGWVIVAGVVGFAGNELVAVYRIRVGRKIGSAALVADGLHARTDGFTSLAVVAGAIGVLAGWQVADPIVGLLITIAILFVLKNAARDIYRRLMDAVDPALVATVESEALGVTGVHGIENVRIRWVGHELCADLNITVDRNLSVADAHDIAETVQHELIHHISRLADATIHVNPTHKAGDDPHVLTAHHRVR